MNNTQLDFNQIIIGSGFGGSVSALCLTEKGNKVLIPPYSHGYLGIRATKRGG